MGGQTFEVHLEAEQVTETHRTLEADRSVTEAELPGLINVYLVINGGRILFDQIKAPRVLEAIEVAKQTEQTAAQTATADTQQSQPEQPQPEQPQV